MFDNLSNKLSQTVKNIRGLGKFTEENIDETLKKIRLSLLEADVALPVVKSFVEEVKNKAIGQKVSQNLTPGQAFVKLVKSELTSFMGGETHNLNLKTQPPAIILLAGLQGAGKTTTAAKLAYLLKQDKKKVALVSADVYRPAAIEQLKTLSQQIDVNFIESSNKEKPVVIVKKAVKEAKQSFCDILIIDTAGRLAVDEKMMQEISQISKKVNPIETLFVIDSMTGQDAINTAKAFDEALSITGMILTKADGDARGGAALSAKYITGKPIKFIGMGEKIDNLEIFHPDRIASRILDMGDVLSLVEEIERKVDKKKSLKTIKKIRKGKTFTFSDFRQQLLQMQQMGGMSAMLEKLPGVAQNVTKQVDDSQFVQMIAMVNSMTKQERRIPEVIKGSRKRRICAGSGTEIQDLNRMLKQFKQMQKMMKKMKGGKMKQMMRGLGGNMGGSDMPPPGGFAL